MDFIKFYILLNIILVITAECPRGWNHYDNKCYYFSHDLLNWYDASYICEAHKSNLAVVETPEENDFLQLEAQSRSASFWLGGSDDFVEKDWRWVLPNVKFNFTDWGPHQPDNLGTIEDCMMMYSAAMWKWYDTPCTISHHFICEKNYPGSVDHEWEVIG